MLRIVILLVMDVNIQGGDKPAPWMQFYQQSAIADKYIRSYFFRFLPKYEPHSFPLPPLLACGSLPHEPTGSPAHWLIPARNASQ